MSDNFTVQQELLRLANSFPGSPKEEQLKHWERFNAFIKSLISEGWSRGDVYEAVHACLFDNRPRLSTSGDDALSNYLSALAGHCDPDYVIRFPSDPENRGEFLEYVRGLHWMKRKSGPADGPAQR